MGKILNYNLVIIGGGAGGIMAALAAAEHHPHDTIAIVDGTFSLGRKILVSGAGRCNLYNEKLAIDPEQYYYNSDKRLLRSVFRQFGYEQIKAFFTKLGIATFVETKGNLGKVFPITEKAHNVLELLKQALLIKDINIHLETKVESIAKDESNKFLLTAKVPEGSAQFICDHVILAAGGKTYPALGSDGSGFNLANKLGHRIIEPVPAALPLCAKDELCYKLQGTKISVGLQLWKAQEMIAASLGDLLFTKYGVSGSAVFDISRNASILINREKQQNLKLIINFSGKERQQVHRLLLNSAKETFALKLPYSLYGMINHKLADQLVKSLDITGKYYNELSSKQQESLLTKLCSYQLEITGTRGWNEAEFTSGGIDTNEVDSSTLESLICPGLYLCGEVLNIDGQIGGFNLGWAWSSGAVAGRLQ